MMAYYTVIGHSYIYNQDLVRLQFIGAKGWLSCYKSVCHLNKYKNTQTCEATTFQIIAWVVTMLDQDMQCILDMLMEVVSGWDVF